MVHELFGLAEENIKLWSEFKVIDVSFIGGMDFPFEDSNEEIEFAADEPMGMDFSLIFAISHNYSF